MMKFLVILMCTVFTFVSLGGNIYIHKCQQATLYSLYDQIDTKNCPFCKKHSKSASNQQNQCDGDCKNSVLKIDQLSDKSFHFSQTFFGQLSPAITPILWIIDFVIISQDSKNPLISDSFYTFTDTSPPRYLQNCIFRI